MIILTGTKTLVDRIWLVSAVSPSHPHLKFRLSLSCGSNEKIADRLVRAVNAGVAFANVRAEKDIYDQEYIAGDFRFLMRHINAELKRVGF